MKVTRVKNREQGQRMVFESIFPCARMFCHFTPALNSGIWVVVEWDWSEEGEYVDSDYSFPVPVGECGNPVHTIALTDSEAVVCFECGGTRNV